MSIDPPAPLRILVGCVFRLAFRAFTSSRTDLPAADHDVAPSHVLLARVTAGETADLMLSGGVRLNALVAREGAPAEAVATDALMAAARPEIGLNERNFLERLLDDRVRVVVARPGVHASGDLAFAMFARAESLVAGARGLLEAKARQTLVPPHGSQVPWGPRRVMDVLGSGEADVVLASRSVLRTLSAVADLVTPGPDLAGQMVVGSVVLSQVPERRRAARQFADALLDSQGQALLARHGFGPPPVA